MGDVAWDAGRPLSFPDLPGSREGTHWGPNALQAHGIIRDAYYQASQLLRQEDGDPPRLRIHSDQLHHKIAPLLEVLGHEVQSITWTMTSAHALGKLIRELEDAASAAEGRSEGSASSPEPVGNTQLIHEQIMADQQRHIRHEPIDVPNISTPFQSIEGEEVFNLALKELRDLGIIPNGYGVGQSEWVNGSYPEIEIIKVGHGGKEYHVDLPFVIWWPRAVAWAQGLDVMTRICMVENGEL
ncbi:hypothetical protein HYDPIDRAFT_28831 [Hydnomerulius pinastri MD-312]|uniref:Uncharacterized protein n=1 Tax=Hydnomerulius pinastri MD-312 TaxID=994086 RepID=A0A0C9VZP5_9AGAM|nr:hypothetical protein HYDPIDRAFT_28831 [Hydnomerulius pinastri MD-312]